MLIRVLLSLVFLVNGDVRARYSSIDACAGMRMWQGMIVKRRDGDRSCGLSRALEELMSPSKAYATLQREIRLAERKRKWNLDALVSGGQVCGRFRSRAILGSETDQEWVCACLLSAGQVLLSV